MNSAPIPRIVVWEVTYACPLRCIHCYSESGRRHARHLPPKEMMRLAEAILSIGPQTVIYSGGEPLLLPNLTQVAEVFARAGVQNVLYTSGWGLQEEFALELLPFFDRVHVSLDAPTAELNDRLRGRAGAFDQALKALALIARLRRASPRVAKLAALGLECVVLRSNFEQLEKYCSVLSELAPAAEFLHLGVVAPSGLATRVSFETQEFLTDEQRAILDLPAFVEQLRRKAPQNVEIQLAKGEYLRSSAATTQWHVEPDAVLQVRSLLRSFDRPRGLTDERAPAVRSRAGDLHRSPQSAWEQLRLSRNGPHKCKLTGQSAHGFSAGVFRFRRRFLGPQRSPTSSRIRLSRFTRADARFC